MNTGPLSPYQAAVRRFEDISPHNKIGFHACMMRDDHGKRYAVFGDEGKVWALYVYVFDEAQWYGMKHDTAMVGEIRSSLIHVTPAPTNMIRWQSALVVHETAMHGVAFAVRSKMIRAVKGDGA